MRGPQTRNLLQRAEWIPALTTGFYGLMGFMALCADRPETEPIPRLLPPRGEIPPGFWEQHTGHVAAAALFLLGLVFAGVWWWIRPRPEKTVPPAERAREVLSPLSSEPETGLVLTRVSQALRGYFGSAFGLFAGELTTAEFSQAISHSDRVAPDLANATVDLLRRCDERKFAPSPPLAPLGAASEALKLIHRAEAHRLELAKEHSTPRADSRRPAATVGKGDAL